VKRIDRLQVGGIAGEQRTKLLKHMKAFSPAILAGLVLAAAAAQAAISIETVAVGDIGNGNDPTTGYGSVGHSYNIGKYEVTIGQYTAFLNAVAATDTYSLYNTSMGTNMNVAGISRSGSSGSYTYAVMDNAGSSANRPITYVSWFDAARFSNWMANGQPTGEQGNATTENGAYTLNGAMSGVSFTKNTINPNTSATTTYWIPSENEWYKAAYYDPSPSGPSGDYWLYPTRSDSAPGNTIGAEANQANYTFYNGSSYIYSVTQSSSYSSSQNYLTDGGAFSGSGSFYGTFDQGGNVWEWNDRAIADFYRGIRGGAWDVNEFTLDSGFNNADDPSNGQAYIGFRVASVPEPSAAMLALLSGAGWFVWKGRKVTL